jgi:hypothetical protein
VSDKRGVGYLGCTDAEATARDPPNVNQEGLVLPNEAGLLKTLGICLVCAFAMTILYVSIPLFMLDIFVPLGPWLGVVLLVSFPALTVVLFVLSTYETRQLRRLAQQL